MAKTRQNSASISNSSRSRAASTSAARGQGRGGVAKAAPAARGRRRGAAAAAALTLIATATASTAATRTSTRITRQSATQTPSSWTAPDLNEDPEAILRQARRAVSRGSRGRARGARNRQTARPARPARPQAQGPQAEDGAHQQPEQEDIPQADSGLEDEAVRNDEPASTGDQASAEDQLPTTSAPSAAQETVWDDGPVSAEKHLAYDQRIAEEMQTGDQHSSSLPENKPDDVDVEDEESTTSSVHVEDLLQEAVQKAKDFYGTASSQIPAAKRPAEDETETSSPTQKARIGNNHICQGLNIRLSELKAQHPWDFTGPVIAGDDLKLNVIFQALASVTEAINETRESRGQSTMFSLFHPLSITKNDGDNTPVVHPRHEALVPIFRGSPTRDHYSLIILRQVGVGRFAIDHLDSNRSLRASFDRPYASDPTRKLMINSGWLDHDDADDLLERQVTTVTELSDHREGCNWAVGIHAILNGWSYAFGWRLSSNAQVDRSDFYNIAADLINLAIHGHLDQATILAFFNCYGYIQADQTAATLEGRIFENGTTTAFSTIDDLDRHVKTANGSIETSRPAGAGVSRANSIPAAASLPRSSSNGENVSPTTLRQHTRLDDLMDLKAPVHIPESQPRPDDKTEAEEYLAGITGNPTDEIGSLDDEPVYDADDDDDEEKDEKEKEKDDEESETAPSTTQPDRFDFRGRLIIPGQPRPPSPRNPFHWTPPSARQPQQEQREESVQLEDPEDRELFGDDEESEEDEDLYSGTFGASKPQPQNQTTSPTTPSLALPPLRPAATTATQLPSLLHPTPTTPSPATFLPGLTQTQQPAPTAPIQSSTPIPEVSISSPPHFETDGATRAEEKQAEAEVDQAYTVDDFGEDVQDDHEEDDNVWVPGYGEEGGEEQGGMVRDVEDEARY